MPIQLPKRIVVREGDGDETRYYFATFPLSIEAPPYSVAYRPLEKPSFDVLKERVGTNGALLLVRVLDLPVEWIRISRFQLTIVRQNPGVEWSVIEPAVLTVFAEIFGKVEIVPLPRIKHIVLWLRRNVIQPLGWGK